MSEQYRGEKASHSQSEYGIREKAVDFPMMCNLNFAFACNSQCPNCPFTNSDIRAQYKDALFMDEATFHKIADEAGQYGAFLRLSGGGEPMLHPQAVELMEYGKKAGVRIGVITNGSLFTEQNTRRILQANVDMIEFSVDTSDPAQYHVLRKGLNWDKLVQNVTRMVQMRHSMKSETKIIASAVNQEGVDIDKTIEFWDPIVDYVQIRKYLTWGINEDHSADKTPYLESNEKIPCPWLFERLNIDTRGQILQCGYDIRGNTNYGNVHEMSIRDAWLGKGFENIRKLHLERRGEEIDICRECPDWKYRSWKHNYWKIVDGAEKKKRQRLKAVESGPDD